MWLEAQIIFPKTRRAQSESQSKGIWRFGQYPISHRVGPPGPRDSAIQTPIVVPLCHGPSVDTVLPDHRQRHHYQLSKYFAQNYLMPHRHCYDPQECKLKAAHNRRLSLERIQLFRFRKAE